MNMLTNPKQSMPDISETLTSWFGGGTTPAIGGAKKTTKTKALKKKQQILVEGVMVIFGVYIFYGERSWGTKGVR